MSRYYVDKALKLMAHNDDRGPMEQFLRAPDAFLKGFDLTWEERQALVSLDIGALYRMGAQPFLISTWARLLSKDDGPTFVRKYVEATRPYGTPDYET